MPLVMNARRPVRFYTVSTGTVQGEVFHHENASGKGKYATFYPIEWIVPMEWSEQFPLLNLNVLTSYFNRIEAIGCFAMYSKF